MSALVTRVSKTATVKIDSNVFKFTDKQCASDPNVPVLEIIGICSNVSAAQKIKDASNLPKVRFETLSTQDEFVNIQQAYSMGSTIIFKLQKIKQKFNSLFTSIYFEKKLRPFLEKFKIHEIIEQNWSNLCSKAFTIPNDVIESWTKLDSGYFTKFECQCLLARALIYGLTLKQSKPFFNMQGLIGKLTNSFSTEFANFSKMYSFLLFILDDEKSKNAWDGVFYSRYNLSKKQQAHFLTQVLNNVPQQFDHYFANMKNESMDGHFNDPTKHYVVTDFANKAIGGGIFGGGTVQEEIYFTEHPALCVLTCLFHLRPMNDTECMCFTTPKQYVHVPDSLKNDSRNNYQGGYIATAFTEPPQMTRPFVIAIDAIQSHNSKIVLPAFYKSNTRNFWKFVSGYKYISSFVTDVSKQKKPIEIRTGNLGLGAFAGTNNPFGIFLGPLFAAIVLNNPVLSVVYYAFDNLSANYFKQFGHDEQMRTFCRDNDSKSLSELMNTFDKLQSQNEAFVKFTPMS